MNATQVFKNNTNQTKEQQHIGINMTQEAQWLVIADLDEN